MQHPEVEDVAWIYNGKDEVPPTVRRVKIAENIMKIPDETFCEHPELEEVILSSSVQVIGRQAFWSCKKLKRILYQGQEKEEVGIPSNVRVIDLMAFAECKLLKNLGLNEGLEEIGESAFRQCESLTEVNVPSTVKVICDQTFHGCISLARLGLNEGLRCIRSDAFNICQSLTEVEFPSTVKSIGRAMFWHCGLLARLGLNEGLRRIGHSAFIGCRVLTKVDFPSTVQVVDDCAFSYCTSLSRLGLNEGLEEIGESAFASCESLTEVEIPSTVKVIGCLAFWGCKLLVRLGLNEGLEQIGEYAFAECESLTTVDIPSTVKVIDKATFWKCKHLARVALHEGLKRIETGVFEECDSLSHVRIPQSVSSIATDAFSFCNDLISMELPEDSSFDIDLLGCLSLVSLAGPKSIVFEREEEGEHQFFKCSKLGRLVDNKADLIRRLNRRFDNSLLNKLCYYQSYHSYEDAMVQLRSRMGENPLAATSQVDEFGMTPLHILSLSQTPNMDMLLAVMDAGKRGHMARIRDSFGCTPMDYLSLNRMPNSNEVVRRLFQTRFGQVLGGLDKFWKSDMLQAIDETLAADWSSRKNAIGRVVRKFERKDILSLLELCLWKVKIDEGTPKKLKIGEATSREEQILADRQRCRVMSGADVVIRYVLPFLDN